MPSKALSHVNPLLCLSVFSIGLAALVGWAFDISLLKSVFSGSVTMKPVTAICFVLLSTGLFVRNVYKETSGLLLALVMSLMAFTLGGFVDLGAALDDPNPVMTVGRGVPSIMTMVLFSGMSAAAYSRDNTVIFAVGMASFLFSSLGIVGHLFSVPVLYAYVPGYSTAMAFNTSIAFLLLSISLLDNR